MPRRGWENLSDTYRTRLERSGVTRSSYESGISLRGARGHAYTPERPAQAYKRPTAFRPYLARREQRKQHYQFEATPGRHSDEVKAALAQRIQQIQQETGWYVKGALDPDYPPLDHPPAPDDEEIAEILGESDNETLRGYARDAALGTQPEMWFLWYH